MSGTIPQADTFPVEQKGCEQAMSECIPPPAAAGGTLLSSPPGAMAGACARHSARRREERRRLGGLRGTARGRRPHGAEQARPFTATRSIARGGRKTIVGGWPQPPRRANRNPPSPRTRASRRATRQGSTQRQPGAASLAGRGASADFDGGRRAATRRP